MSGSLKQFRKWWEENGCHVWDIRGCEASWKAALEWAKNMAHLYAKDSELEDIFLEEMGND